MGLKSLINEGQTLSGGRDIHLSIVEVGEIYPVIVLNERGINVFVGYSAATHTDKFCPRIDAVMFLFEDMIEPVELDELIANYRNLRGNVHDEVPYSSLDSRWKLLFDRLSTEVDKQRSAFYQELTQ